MTARKPPCRGLARWRAGWSGGRPPGADFAVLAALEKYGPLSQADPGRRFGLDRNDVSGIVEGLESGSQVDRRADPQVRDVITVNRAYGERRRFHAHPAKSLKVHRHEPA